MHNGCPPAPHFAIEELGTEDFNAWNTFVEAHENGTVFHRAEWKTVIERSFGHDCYYLMAKSEQAVSGALPLVHINSKLFGNGLISNGFCVYGGPLAADDVTRRQLDAAAVALAERLGVDYLEYRLRSPDHPDWVCNSELYATFRKPISSNPDENYHGIPRKQRAMVRKGRANGLESVLEDDIETFFRLYSESVRNLGTPVFPKAYFAHLLDTFGDACRILTVRHGSEPIASVMSLLFRNEILPYYGGGSLDARRLAANDFMYWELMKCASEWGCTLFDFGRSKKGTGSYAFKKNWGFVPEPLFYEYRLFGTEVLPQVNPLNPRYQLMIAIWKRLPLALANIVGPWISRNLG